MATGAILAAMRLELTRRGDYAVRAMLALASSEVAAGATGNGWQSANRIAAEMATMCTDNLEHLVLVDAAGIQPQEAETADIFVAPWPEVIRRSFFDAPAAPEYRRP